MQSKKLSIHELIGNAVICIQQEQNRRFFPRNSAAVTAMKSLTNALRHYQDFQLFIESCQVFSTLMHSMKVKDHKESVTCNFLADCLFGIRQDIIQEWLLTNKAIQAIISAETTPHSLPILEINDAENDNWEITSNIETLIFNNENTLSLVEKKAVLEKALLENGVLQTIRNFDQVLFIFDKKKYECRTPIPADTDTLLDILIEVWEDETHLPFIKNILESSIVNQHLNDLLSQERNGYIKIHAIKPLFKDLLEKIKSQENIQLNALQQLLLNSPILLKHLPTHVYTAAVEEEMEAINTTKQTPKLNYLAFLLQTFGNCLTTTPLTGWLNWTFNDQGPVVQTLLARYLIPEVNKNFINAEKNWLFFKHVVDNNIPNPVAANAVKETYIASLLAP